MKVATLQFAPRLGDVDGNIKRANELLKDGKVVRGVGIGVGLDLLKPDVLILPELALTGYNFPSLEAIRPFLEPVGQGPSAQWARETAKRLQCKVCVGYPEIYTDDGAQQADSTDSRETCYNSLLVVDESGDIVLNYRKSFLYYTDETWAAEGDPQQGFHQLSFRNSNQSSVESQIATSFGICMDINPYRFEAPFTAWEFANRVLDTKSELVILSMAWLTLLERDELDSLGDEPDLDTFNYWIQRFMPLIRKKMGHATNFDGDDANRGKKIIIVFANRAGEEPGAEGTNPARYAGTSAIVAVTQKPPSCTSGKETSSKEGDPGDDTDAAETDAPSFDTKILCWDMMGATTEGICFADTTADPSMVFGLVKALK
ncbi:hydrolase, carbon-nitrogen family protein [Aspergillus costaricaensis CBS 115574]|uniref:Hydrolase, carbon-nitrogen family protein n=1 Tax=Aspergillus costaricaensis CBS 115574 TaxID=1448317 RepID=A0ACD1IDN3_9EURO|nr:hydrolase, carbon-nitrogen family protein [Aspergillus costaricaensis CBS 115574]RAK88692.1 hydrolase, carbon-nitrogen family protein [Aspergillus costaricaensis CBS 115574]